MDTEAELDAVYAPSQDVVYREIEGEAIIVPLTAGIGDVEDALFTLNETGKLIWSKLDGKSSLNAIAESLSNDFEAPPQDLRRDLCGFIGELLKRGIVSERSA